jgi:hypothetical protein
MSGEETKGSRGRTPRKVAFHFGVYRGGNNPFKPLREGFFPAHRMDSVSDDYADRVIEPEFYIIE